MIHKLRIVDKDKTETARSSSKCTDGTDGTDGTCGFERRVDLALCQNLYRKYVS